MSKHTLVRRTPYLPDRVAIRKAARGGALILVLATAAVVSTGTGALAAGGAAGAVGRDDPSCDAGEFCVWSGERYTGDLRRLTLETANPGECVPLPDALVARSFANRLHAPVTVYQGADCSTEADFTTYPGGGTYVPSAPFVVRAVQVWQR